MAYFRCNSSSGGGGGSAGDIKIVGATIESNRAVTQTVSDNTEETLYAMVFSNSSNASVRETNTTIVSLSGCSVDEVQSILLGTVLYRMYRLSDCQSSVSITTGSGSSSSYKNVVIMKR